MRSKTCDNWRQCKRIQVHHVPGTKGAGTHSLSKPRETHVFTIRRNFRPSLLQLIGQILRLPDITISHSPDISRFLNDDQPWNPVDSGERKERNTSQTPSYTELYCTCQKQVYRCNYAAWSFETAVGNHAFFACGAKEASASSDGIVWLAPRKRIGLGY